MSINVGLIINQQLQNQAHRLRRQLERTQNSDVKDAICFYIRHLEKQIEEYKENNKKDGGS